ncbi:MAG: hypothetical protein KGL94_13070 [Acidobacteriota bacterium]|nr:hypothetical protein [Acidobacteriota bacterium]
MSRGTAKRRWPTAVAIAAAAVAIGAVFGSPHSGRAAGQATPASTATPTISGTPQEGSTLTASNGTWSGSPTGYAYAWGRCDQNGDNCATITGATAQTYQAQAADVDHTLRVTVTATNADGSMSATSAPTAVVSSASAPGNSGAPTISGTPQVGSTLTAAKGSWSGSPTSYAYAWSRCDQTGSSCADIAGATASTYTLAQVDAGNTLRVRVTATNSAGATSATSVPTAVVQSPPPTVANGCPTTGAGTIQVADVNPPARLVIDRQSLTPGVVTPGAATLQLSARVTACNGRPVQGALLYATGVPYNQYSVPAEATTGADGTATLTMSQLSGFPAARRQELFVVFLRARKPSDPITGGISTRLLVSFPVSLR